MPSQSAAQHRWIGWLHSNPEARERSGMSKAKVDEWLHSDRGSPWMHRDGGGSLPVAGSVDPYLGMGMNFLAQMRSNTGNAGLNDLPGMMMGGAGNPTAAMVQQYAQLPEETLQELSVRVPPNSQQGTMINRILAARRMQTASEHARSGILPSGTQASELTSPAAPSGGRGILDDTSQLPQQHRGGYVHRDEGGGIGMPLSMASPWWERSEERGMESGYLHGSTFGRADHLTTTAPGGSYIVPADVISGIGEGNSLAGAAAVEHWLNTGPWGTRLPRGKGGGRGLPHAPMPHSVGYPEVHDAKGGGVQGGVGSGRVPVKLSHGEYQIGPRHVLAIGRHLLKKHGGTGRNDRLAMKLGHDALDAWVVHERKKVADKMKKLPGPTRAAGGRLAA